MLRSPKALEEGTALALALGLRGGEDEPQAADGEEARAAAEAEARAAAEARQAQAEAARAQEAAPSPATHAILRRLKAGGCVKHFW